MPTKRELREQEENMVNEDLENTVQLNLDEIVKTEEDELDVPNFSSNTKPVSNCRAATPTLKQPLNNMQPQGDDLDDDYDYDDDDDTITIPKPIIVGLVVFIAFLAVVLVLLFRNVSTTTQEQSATASPTATATATTEATQGLSLDFYHTQAVKTAITSVLDEELGDYTEPSTSQFSYDGSEASLEVSFDVEAGDAYSKTYVIPATFNVVWDNDTETYKVTSYSLDTEKAEESGWTSNSTKKEAKEQAKETAESGSEVSNFTVTVRNNVTVTVTAKGSGKVTAYAVSEDGTKTELASAEGGTVTKTTDLDAGDYELVLYAEEGAGYSWNYNLG